MKTVETGAKYSAIVGIGEELKKKSQETGQEFLYLNRGINAVVPIDLSEIIPQIDFNSNTIQVYPANSGLDSLKKAINSVYFHAATSNDNLFITNGGMNALDLIIKTLDVNKIYMAEYFWGAYKNIMLINGRKFDTYAGLEDIKAKIAEIKNNALILCDPNNPLGTKFKDEALLEVVDLLNANNVTIIWDSPYRRLFKDETDDMYLKLLNFEHVIITDSFSKSIGLSGQRIGFVHTQNESFNKQFNINLLYNTNGINAFSQVLVEKILTTKQGKLAAEAFRQTTVRHIVQNILYLIEKKILAAEFYQDADPVGIFVIVNKSYQQLLDAGIGSVPLSFFTLRKDEAVNRFARICVSVNHEKFKQFFNKLLQ